MWYEGKRHVCHVLHAACSIMSHHPHHMSLSQVVDGYGTTEAGGVTSDNVVFVGSRVKLIDVPEMDYYTTDKPNPRGEICVKSETMISGYVSHTTCDAQHMYHVV